MRLKWRAVTRRALWSLLVCGGAWAPVVATAAVPEAPTLAPLAEPAAVLTADAQYVADWALQSGDTRQQPFAVVDKRAARIYVFEADGRLIGAANALLGLAPGDHSVPGVGTGDVNRIPEADRTTPAGRFNSQPGRNLTGEAIVWFDYDAALAIHRVRPGASQARRLEHLASGSPKDKRMSLGCVVVAPAFYDAVIQPVLGQRRGVVYVLPETQPARALFGRPQAPLAQQ